MNVQGVSISTASSMDVQGVSLSTAKSMDVKGEVLRLLLNLCDFHKKIHTLGYGFKNL
jgi:hypothetical protein